MGQMIAYLKEHAGLATFCLVGAVLCGGLAVMLQPREPELPAYDRLQTKAGDYYPGGTSCKPAEIDRLPVGDRQGKRDACAEEREEHRLIEDDLRQQTRSADAAQAMPALGYHQSLVLLYGLVFGVATLMAAILAAKFARDAAKETKRAADIAESAFEAETRARVMWEGFNTIMSNDTTNGDNGQVVGRALGIVPKLTNHGKAPAVRAFVRRDFILQPFSSREVMPHFKEEVLPDGKLVIPPNTLIGASPVFIHTEDLRAFLARETVMFVQVQAAYYDLGAKKGAPRRKSVSVYSIYFNGWEKKPGTEELGPNISAQPLISDAT